jgi:hypothetical protein
MSLRDDGKMADAELDEVSRALANLEAKLGEVAAVGRKTLEYGIVAVDVKPRNPQALAMTWLVMKDEIVFQAGRHGGRWELAKTLKDVAWMERVADAVVSGHVCETFGPKRSRVEVTMEDGTTETETGYSTGSGLLPVPGWRRRGRTVKYASYFE